MSSISVPVMIPTLILLWLHGLKFFIILDIMSRIRPSIIVFIEQLQQSRDSSVLRQPDAAAHKRSLPCCT
jgi:hypothetical protein